MHLILSFSIYEHSYLCTLFNSFIGNDIITKEIDKSICKKKMYKNYVRKSKPTRFLNQIGLVLLFLIFFCKFCFYIFNAYFDLFKLFMYIILTCFYSNLPFFY